MKRMLFFSIFLTIGSFFAAAQAPEAAISVASAVNQIDVTVTVPDGYRQGWNPDFFGIDIPASEAFSRADVVFPDGFSEGDYLEGTFTLSVVFHAVAETSLQTELTLRYQLCDADGLCFMPIRTQLPVTVELSPETSSLPDENSSAEDAAARSLPLALVLLLAFAGGLLLNVMPCVLPVLSLKAFSILRQSGADRRGVLIHSLLYAVGIIVSLLILAAATAVFRAGGQSVLGYLIFLIILLTAIAFSMFDVLTIALPGGVKTRSHRSLYAESFFTGILAVLLATPCTAPLLGAAVGFALTESVPVIFAVFFFIGVGLAFPFLLIGFFPQSIRFLPKPGNWMNTVKEATGFILLGVAVWLLSVLGALTAFLGWLLLLVFSFWIWKKYVMMGSRRLLRAAALVAIAALLVPSGAALIPTERADGRGGSDFAEYERFSSDAVSDAMHGGNPVFVVFSADWCLTCQTNETVLNSSEITTFFKENGVRFFYGDYTEGDEEISAWLKRYGRAGVPFSLFVGSDGRETVLPELLTKNKIKSLLKP